MLKSNKSVVIIVHGWASSPKRGWIGWLDQTLSKEFGYHVFAPHLPNARRPELNHWIDVIVTLASQNKRVIFVGHSLGTFTILQAILRLPDEVIVEKIILVAAFFVEDKAKYWPEHVITNKEFVQIKKRVKERLVIYSTNDRMVEPNVSARLARRLDADMIPVLNMGHFSNLKVSTLPIVLDAIIS